MKLSANKSKSDNSTILIVEDHPLYREGLARFLKNSGNINSVIEVNTGRDAIEKIDDLKLDLVILDISLPDINGLDLIKKIKVHRPELPILILSMHSEERYAVRLIKAGASGYLTKNSSPTELLDAILKVLAGEVYISAILAKELALKIVTGAKNKPYENLTDREFEIMNLLAQGHTPVEVGECLNLSPSTIFTHRNHILDKLKLKNIYQLIYYAHTHGLVDE